MYINDNPRKVFKSLKSKLVKMSAEMFNASIFISEQTNRQLVNSAQDLAQRCIMECAKKYGFDADEAIRFLGLAMVRLERNAPAKPKGSKSANVSVPKPAFPLPYNGEFNDACCYALRQNNGLYTQCTGLRKGSNSFCKSCSGQMQKSGVELPEYGTIQQRQAVGIFEFVDPKGRSPTPYTKVMKKYKISEEQAREEGGKLNIIINDNHFVVPEAFGVKRGRPSTKVEKEPKLKGSKGRPKKEKKVLMIDGDDDDLFATLVAQANVSDDEEEMTISSKPKKSGKSEEEKEQERLAAEQAKAEREAKLAAEKEAKRLAAEQAKAEKEAKLAAEKAEKEAKKEQERLAREAKKQAEEEERAAKKLALEQAKEAKLAAAKQNKKPLAKKSSKEEEEDDEPDVVKKIEFNGMKYLKSKKTGIVYDYTEYTKNGEQVVVGKWNDTTNKVDFQNDGEESEEEYD
jgi:hypothetical protein